MRTMVRGARVPVVRGGHAGDVGSGSMVRVGWGWDGTPARPERPPALV